MTAASAAIDGSKFKAVNSRDRNFTQGKIEKRLKQLDESIERYLSQLETADRQPATPEIKITRLKGKLDTLKLEIERLKALGVQIAQSEDKAANRSDPASAMNIG